MNIRIALVGNMNNNAFALQRYFIDEGYVSQLYIFDSEPRHFHPSNDTFEENLPEFKFLSWSKENWLETNVKSILLEFENYDFIICQGVAPAFFKKAGIMPNIFMPFGGDMYSLPFYKPTNILKHYLSKIKRVLSGQNSLLPKEIFARYQRMGIQSCEYAISFNEEMKTMITKLKMNDRWLRIPIPMVYTNHAVNLELIYQEFPDLYVLISRIRAENDFVFLSHSRQYWCNHDKGYIDDVSNKGNDRLIKGFARYLEFSKKKTCLLLLEYGPDVEFSKRLCRQLNIMDNICWIPKQPRKNLLAIINECDLIGNEFVNSWLGGGVIFETLSMGKPLMGYRNDELYMHDESILYPMINVSSEEEIFKAFISHEENPRKYHEMGLKGNQWYQQEVVRGSLDFFNKYFSNSFR